MTQINSVFLMPIYFSFQTETELFLVMEFMYNFKKRIGGDLFGLLQKNLLLQERAAKFYLAQVVLALESLHKSNIIHR
jgi:serine/threonine protein kinase